MSAPAEKTTGIVEQMSMACTSPESFTRFQTVPRSAITCGEIAFIGGFALTLWNLKTVWSGGGRRWPAKLWSLALVFATFIVLWIAFAFHLIGWGVNY